MQAQTSVPLSPGTLDPTQHLAPRASSTHTALPEQYLWTAGEVTALRPDRSRYPWNNPTLRTTPQHFRAHFQVRTMPAEATLYLAGPREIHVFFNGRAVAAFASDVDAPIGLHVYHVDVAKALRTGDNVLAVEAVRGRGVVSGSGPEATQQIAYGEVLVAKLLPGPFGATDSAPLLLSGQAWRAKAATATSDPQWTAADFDDSRWPLVASLGPIESNVDFFQWSVDAGMYAWPGYMGMSPALRTFPLTAVAVSHVFAGTGSFANLDALTSPLAGQGLFKVDDSQAATQTDAEAPALLLDFGREVAGRVLVESATGNPVTLSIAYGESELEALATGLTPGQQGGNYLGTNLLEVPALGTARGPKSGFRYVRIRFLRGAPEMAFKTIRVEGIEYPVDHAGSFHSSDPLLDQIWATGAYTVHLCMQDGIWDAVKRDRGRWVGDLDIEGRVISAAFGNKPLLEQTLEALVPAGSAPVNGIPSYSALWITSLQSLYEHTGDRAFLMAQRPALLRILAGMDASLDEQGLLREDKHHWLFVDWSPGLYAFTPAARLGTQLQYVRGFRAAAQLFSALGDAAESARYTRQAERALAAANALRDPGKITFGPGWQLNTLAVLTEPAEAEGALWADVLSHVKQDAPADPVISPYFNAYVLDAMAATGHKQAALAWMRTYWGGMLAEGATSFWESYDLRWPKGNPHLSLQADGTSGFFVSMAHGWSAGPTAWLSENVLGVTPASPGFDTVRLQPDLLDLAFAEGAVPTPHGPIRIRVDRLHGLRFTLPPGVRETEVRWTPTTAGALLLDGKTAVAADTASSEVHLHITGAGEHTLGPR